MYKNRSPYRSPQTSKIESSTKKRKLGNSLVVQWLGCGTFTGVAQVQSLVGELRSHKPLTAVKKKKKKKERKKVHKLGIRKFITIKLLWEMQQVTVPFFFYTNQENEILKLGIANDQGKNTASILK